jgi:hypothetical protein
MSMGRPSRDWMTVLGAEDLARRIELYWKKRGRKVTVRAFHNYDTGNGACHVNGVVTVVRSNMVGGWPPKDPSTPIHMGHSIASKRAASHALVRK